MSGLENGAQSGRKDVDSYLQDNCHGECGGHFGLGRYMLALGLFIYRDGGCGVLDLRCCCCL
jgi:hypothetical protein